MIRKAWKRPGLPTHWVRVLERHPDGVVAAPGYVWLAMPGKVRHEEPRVERLRRLIEEGYQERPTECGGSFGEILCWGIHSNQQDFIRPSPVAPLGCARGPPERVLLSGAHVAAQRGARIPEVGAGGE
jgi:hypothetical protein